MNANIEGAKIEAQSGPAGQQALEIDAVNATFKGTVTFSDGNLPPEARTTSKSGIALLELIDQAHAAGKTWKVARKLGTVQSVNIEKATFSFKAAFNIDGVSKLTTVQNKKTIAVKAKDWVIE
jgi:hypothetical protein